VEHGSTVPLEFQRLNKYRTNTRGKNIFQKSRSHHKILSARSKSHTVESQMLGAAVHNLVATPNWRPDAVQPWNKIVSTNTPPLHANLQFSCAACKPLLNTNYSTHYVTENNAQAYGSPTTLLRSPYCAPASTHVHCPLGITTNIKLDTCEQNT